MTPLRHFPITPEAQTHKEVAMRHDWPAMSDDELVEKAKSQIWLSAFANNNPRAPAHKEADKAYDEAVARGKTYLYCRAWNAAYRSCGYEPSEREIAAARGPSTDADESQ